MSYQNIPGYEGKYAATTKGEIISLKRWRVPQNRRLKPWKDKKGYLCVGLQSPENQQRTWKIHRLIAMTFIEDFDTSLQVNHKDGIKINNHLTNLEMVSPLENILHAVKHGLIKNHGEDGESAKISNYQAEEIRKIYRTGYVSQRQLAEEYEVDQSTIWAIVNYRTFKNVQGG